MESGLLTATISRTDSIDAASIVPVVATTPDPASIPIEPPHGSPPPPQGQLMPDVAISEETASPMKSNTPPPDSPSPAAQAVEQPTPATDAQFESDHANADQSALSSHVLVPPHPEQATVEQPNIDVNLSHPNEPLLAADVFKNEGDGDVIMQDYHNHEQEAPLGLEQTENGIHTESSPHVVYPNSPSALANQSMSQDDFFDGPPPAKRQKLESPAPEGMEGESPSNIPMESPVAPVAPWSRPITQPQNKFAISVVRSLKKNKDAVPFLVPVDPIALNIPHYPTIVTNPMDLSTVEKKLGGAPKTDGAEYQRYENVQQFADDIKLIVENCVKFNGPDHLVSQMAKRVEEAFDKQMKNMPTADDVKPPVMKPGVVKKGAPVRRQSTAGGYPRRDEPYVAARPKREIPAPREQTYHVEPRRPPTKKRFPKRDDGTAEQLKFCTKLINDLYRPKYSTFAYPFYEPVDWVKLDIPTYPKTIKKPMDMATILQKLNSGDYANAQQFHADFKLMIRNCFAFNPAGSPVHQAGIELNDVFDEKWAGLPSLFGDTEDEGVEEDESDNETSNAVLLMEAQIQSLHNALASLKHKKPKKEKVRKPAPPYPAYPAAPAAPKRAPKPAGSNGAAKKKKKSNHDEDESLTFEQKKQLSETIQTLDGGRLEKVLEIIDEVYPEIRETSEEIELDIDSLPAHVLMRLYNFVIRPSKPRVGRPPNGSGLSKASSGVVAGTKRKSMNEEEETAKIKQLEETLARLKNGTATAEDITTAQAANGGPMLDADSQSDSDASDSSGSDSE